MTMSDNTHIITVVGAAIVSDGRVLCARRGTGRHLDGYWEFPGGKVEDGESQRQALRREIREELRCEITVGPLLRTSVQAYDFATISLSVFLCQLVEGSPTLTEHRTLLWLTPDEMRGLDWAPADREAAKLIITGSVSVTESDMNHPESPTTASVEDVRTTLARKEVPQ